MGTCHSYYYPYFLQPGGRALLSKKALEVSGGGGAMVVVYHGVYPKASETRAAAMDISWSDISKRV